jgi:hypothetical protein
MDKRDLDILNKAVQIILGMDYELYEKLVSDNDGIVDDALDVLGDLITEIEKGGDKNVI